MSTERWFPEDRYKLHGFQTKVIGSGGRQWLVVKPEERGGEAGHLTVRVVSDNECSDDLIGHQKCRHCGQPLRTKHLEGCEYLEDETAVEA